MSQPKKTGPVSAEEYQDLINARGNTDPVPILKHKAENRVMRELKEVALRGCEEQVRVFAKCAEGKLLSVVWHCRAFSKAVDACMHSIGQDEALKDEMMRRHGANFPRAVKGYRESSNLKNAEKKN